MFFVCENLTVVSADDDDDDIIRYNSIFLDYNFLKTCKKTQHSSSFILTCVKRK